MLLQGPSGASPYQKSPEKLRFQKPKKNYRLRGTSVAVYIAGQERRLVDPPSQVVAGVRTVTTNMNGRGILPRCRACSLFCVLLSSSGLFFP